MHSLRSLVLAPAFVLAAACSKGDDQAATSSPLDRDLTLSAQLQGTGAPSSAGAELVAGGACRAEHAPVAPTAARRSEALALEQRAAEAEFAGNIAAARDLHRQAARLDGTSEAIAYRLARADEASGDRAAAVAGFCHYLTLAPTAANAREVRSRLDALVGNGAATRLAQGAAPAPTSRSRTAVATAAPVRRAAGHRVSTSGAEVAVSSAAPGVDPSPSKVGEADAVSGASQSPGGTENVAVASTGEVTAPEPPVATTTPSAPATVRRPADHTARNAAIGAGVGAAVGAMTSRSVKGAMIGGVAGGLLGAVVGRTNQSGFRTPGFSH